MSIQNTTLSKPQNQSLPIRRATCGLIQIALLVSLCLWPSLLPAQSSAGEHSGAQSFQDSVSLELGKPIERELSGGLSHFYKITMTSGQFLRIVVKQQGIDVVVILSTPDGRKIAEVDSDHLIEGSETVSATAESVGA